jgi:hypothetical protein
MPGKQTTPDEILAVAFEIADASSGLEYGLLGLGSCRYLRSQDVPPDVQREAFLPAIAVTIERVQSILDRLIRLRDQAKEVP